MLRLEYRRPLGQSRAGRVLDIGLYVMGVVLVLLGMIDLWIGAYATAVVGVLGGIVVAAVPAIVSGRCGVDLDEDIPPGPKGAALIHADGTRSALELVYVGRDEDGLALFRATMPVNFAEGDELVMDELPPMTSIVGHWVVQ